MQHSLLKDVTSESHQWTIRGKAMEAQIPQRWIQQFLPLLKEDSVYYIKYFQVCDARVMYHPVDHPYLMKFTAHTKVTEVKTVAPTFPRYAYSLATYEALRSRIGVTDYCSDAIGVLTGCTHVRIQNTRAGQKKLRNIHLTDGRETITVALWNEHADAFDADTYMEMGTHAPVILLFVATTCGQFEGKLSLQGSTLCKWYANPEIPEATALQDRCAGRIDPPIWHGPGAAHINPERITITELARFDNPHIIYNNRYIVIAKIKKIVSNQSWWYVACEKCNRTAQADGERYKCSNPKCSSTSAAPRYRLPVITSDPVPSTTEGNEPNVELVFFGTVAEEMIGIPADALINAEGGIGAFLPTRITQLYGRQYELRVSVSRASLQRTDIVYQVDSIIGTADAPMALPPVTQTPLIQQTQEVVQQDTVPTSSAPELITAMPTKLQIREPSSSIDEVSARAENTKSAEFATDSTPLAQKTPAISEKKRLKRKLSEREQEQSASDLSDSDPSGTHKARRCLITDEEL